MIFSLFTEFWVILFTEVVVEPYINTLASIRNTEKLMLIIEFLIHSHNVMKFWYQKIIKPQNHVKSKSLQFQIEPALFKTYIHPPNNLQLAQYLIKKSSLFFLFRWLILLMTYTDDLYYLITLTLVVFIYMYLAEKSILVIDNTDVYFSL